MLKITWEIVSATFKAWWNDDVFTKAAALAFYTIFSLAPILLISVGIASLFFNETQAKQQITHEIENLTGEEGGKVVEQVFKHMIDIHQSPKAIAYGLVAVIIGSTAVFVNLQSALNKMWHVQPKTDRSVIKDLLRVRLRSFGIVLAVGFLLLVSMVISAFLSGLQTVVYNYSHSVPWIWQALDVLVSFCIITLLFAMIYKYLPDARISWNDVMTGAAITSVLFSVGKYLIGFYLGHVALGSAYGAAGSFVVLLIWTYYSALICFFGAEFTQVYAARFGASIRPEDHAEKTNKKD